MGYVCLAIVVTCFSVLGISYKLSDRLDCDKRRTNFYLFLAGAVVLVPWLIVEGALPIRVEAIVFGLVYGAAQFLNVVCFREATARGRISTSWAVIQMALVIPVLGSILIWKEIPSTRHCLGLAAVVAAIVFLGADMGRSAE